MYFPIKIYTTPDSYLMVRLSLPIFAKFRMGFKPDRVIGQDRKWFPQMLCMTGQDVFCLHFYVLAISFRIRSNAVMYKIQKEYEGKNIPRFLCHISRGWAQVFQSAII